MNILESIELRLDELKAYVWELDKTGDNGENRDVDSKEKVIGDTLNTLVAI